MHIKQGENDPWSSAHPFAELCLGFCTSASLLLLLLLSSPWVYVVLCNLSVCEPTPICLFSLFWLILYACFIYSTGPIDGLCRIGRNILEYRLGHVFTLWLWGKLSLYRQVWWWCLEMIVLVAYFNRGHYCSFPYSFSHPLYAPLVGLFWISDGLFSGLCLLLLCHLGWFRSPSLFLQHPNPLLAHGSASLMRA